MATRRWYLETSPDGKYQFVSLKRSRSHHHHRHHHHHHEEPAPPAPAPCPTPTPAPPPVHRCCRDDCAHITAPEYNDLLDRERKLRESNDVLARENYALKCNLQASDIEGRRLSALLIASQAENQLLREDNDGLRRTIESSGGNAGKYLREVERLKHKLQKVERELAARLRHGLHHHHHGIGHGVAERIEELKRVVRAWEGKFDVVEERNQRLMRDLNEQRCVIASRDERIREYERILRRHGFIRLPSEIAGHRSYWIAI
ncbi:hypothetical protein BDP81DRAFT_186401 [Colletotrichum phormii]|uniref:Uncharacterized protein n=1 Tax=Colletotrichum phormii TaxID=359342 RepID=A0AAI9ZXE4_9PEZI|nr:uncharacterized protein BDP81DRAFT_186401 [Colletotrichum phormii]KAK1639980.1 hypothetical protein BDP81DRAFT_186401 [Colletotrichum phormii]